MYYILQESYKMNYLLPDICYMLPENSLKYQVLVDINGVSNLHRYVEVLLKRFILLI